MVFRWNPKANAYEPADAVGLGRYRDFLQGLLDDGEIATEAVRRRAVKFYGNGD
jgi:hypothetical protein